MEKAVFWGEGGDPLCRRHQPVGYMPRQTHECDAAVLVRQHLAEFLGRCDERAGPLPEFVKGEFEGFAGCGDLELGFVRTCGRTCGDELRVPFACKSRGFCPSCMGRRMVRVDLELPLLGTRRPRVVPSSDALGIGASARGAAFAARRPCTEVGSVARGQVASQRAAWPGGGPADSRSYAVAVRGCSEI